MRTRYLLLLAATGCAMIACKDDDRTPAAICPPPAADHQRLFPMPDAFSPDGDGRNDRLFPFPDSTITGLELTVSDRSGVVITETSGLRGWDGIDRRSGTISPPAPYLEKYRVARGSAAPESGELYVTIFGPATARRCVLAPAGCHPDSYTFADQYDMAGNWYSTAGAICIE